MDKTKLKIDLRSFELGDGDLIAVFALEDKPGRVSIIAEKIESGVSKRRVIELPEDPLLLAALAQSLMQIADIRRISFSKNKPPYMEFGEKHAKQVFDRTRQAGCVQGPTYL